MILKPPVAVCNDPAYDLEISENLDPGVARQVGSRLPVSDLSSIRSQAETKSKNLLGIAIRIAIILAGDPSNLKPHDLMQTPSANNFKTSMTS